jgi:hypothetical protein
VEAESPLQQLLASRRQAALECLVSEFPIPQLDIVHFKSKLEENGIVIVERTGASECTTSTRKKNAITKVMCESVSDHASSLSC